MFEPDRLPLLLSSVQEHLVYLLRMLHWSTLGQTKHSSLESTLSGGVLRSPLKWAHLAGESKTVGYSVALMLMIFSFSVMMSSRDMQKGQA